MPTIPATNVIAVANESQNVFALPVTKSWAIYIIYRTGDGSSISIHMFHKWMLHKSCNFHWKFSICDEGARWCLPSWMLSPSIMRASPPHSMDLFLILSAVNHPIGRRTQFHFKWTMNHFPLRIIDKIVNRKSKSKKKLILFESTATSYNCKAGCGQWDKRWRKKICQWSADSEMWWQGKARIPFEPWIKNDYNQLNLFVSFMASH